MAGGKGERHEEKSPLVQNNRWLQRDQTEWVLWCLGLGFGVVVGIFLFRLREQWFDTLSCLVFTHM